MRTKKAVKGEAALTLLRNSLRRISSALVQVVKCDPWETEEIDTESITPATADSFSRFDIPEDNQTMHVVPVSVLSQRLRRRPVGLRQSTLVEALIVTWHLVWTEMSDGSPAILDQYNLRLAEPSATSFDRPAQNSRLRGHAPLFPNSSLADSRPSLVR